MVLPLGENKGGGKLGGHSHLTCAFVFTLPKGMLSHDAAHQKLYEELLSLLW